MNVRTNISLCVLALASTCLADIQLAKPRGTPVTLDVRTAPGATVTLRIPADLLKSARAAGLDFYNDNDSGSRFRNVIAGVLLSLSFGVAGIWVVRRKLSLPAQAAIILTALLLAGSSITLADMRGGGASTRRPRPPIQPSGSSFPPGTLLKLREALGSGTLSGKVAVEIVAEGQPITLLVPASQR